MELSLSRVQNIQNRSGHITIIIDPDAGLQRCLFHQQEVEVQLLEQEHRRKDGSCVLCFALLDSAQAQNCWGHLKLQVHGVPSWQPFTIVRRANGSAELHILLIPRVEDGIAGEYANWSSQTKSKVVAAARYYPNKLPIRWTGPFGGKLSNSDLYPGYHAVVFVCWGTGFTTITQALYSLSKSKCGQQVPTVYVLWRGSRSEDERYFSEKVQPICEEYQIQAERLQQIWDRDRFKEAVIQVVERYTKSNQIQKVFVGMCGGSPAVHATENAIWERLQHSGATESVRVETEVFG